MRGTLRKFNMLVGKEISIVTSFKYGELEEKNRILVQTVLVYYFAFWSTKTELI